MWLLMKLLKTTAYPQRLFPGPACAGGGVVQSWRQMRIAP
jgi:hypothetical protein